MNTIKFVLNVSAVGVNAIVSWNFLFHLSSLMRIEYEYQFFSTYKSYVPVSGPVLELYEVFLTLQSGVGTVVKCSKILTKFIESFFIISFFIPDLGKLSMEQQDGKSTEKLKELVCHPECWEIIGLCAIDNGVDVAFLKYSDILEQHQPKISRDNKMKRIRQYRSFAYFPDNWKKIAEESYAAGTTNDAYILSKYSDTFRAFGKDGTHVKVMIKHWRYWLKSCVDDDLDRPVMVSMVNFRETNIPQSVMKSLEAAFIDEMITTGIILTVDDVLQEAAKHINLKLKGSVSTNKKLIYQTVSRCLNKAIKKYELQQRTTRLQSTPKKQSKYLLSGISPDIFVVNAHGREGAETFLDQSDGNSERLDEGYFSSSNEMTSLVEYESESSGGGCKLSNDFEFEAEIREALLFTNEPILSIQPDFSTDITTSIDLDEISFSIFELANISSFDTILVSSPTTEIVMTADDTTKHSTRDEAKVAGHSHRIVANEAKEVTQSQYTVVNEAKETEEKSPTSSATPKKENTSSSPKRKLSATGTSKKAAAAAAGGRRSARHKGDVCSSVYFCVK